MKDVIVKFASKVRGLSRDEVFGTLEVPQNDSLGDYSLPCFGMAKKEKKSPLVIAEELAEKLRVGGLPKEISNVSFNGGYVNFFVDKKLLAELVLKRVKEIGFGMNNLGKGKSVGIEFSQPNTHKAFHVGHIRGTCIGESLARIFEASGRWSKQGFCGRL